MFRLICFGLILLVQGIAADLCDCQCDPPLKTLYQVCPHFKEVHACNRHFITSVGVSEDGVRSVCYKGELNKYEKTSDVCDCIFDYINQVDWLVGSTTTCCTKDNFAVLTVFGQPDPEFEDTMLDPPLELFKKLLDQFPTAIFENLSFRPYTELDECGCIHFHLEFDLSSDSERITEVCDNIIIYLNQDLWLGNLTSTCTSIEEILHIEIKKSFHKHPLEIDLTQACVGELNTIIRGDLNWPIIYGIGVNIKTGEIFPAAFTDKGPDLHLRMARKFTGGQSVLDIYDSQLGMLRIGPFNYDPYRGVDLWLAQNDEFLLQHLSTSPEVEPPHFAMQMRSTLKYIQDNQFPAVTVFRDNRPHYYHRDETTGCWQQTRYT